MAVRARSIAILSSFLMLVVLAGCSKTDSQPYAASSGEPGAEESIGPQSPGDQDPMAMLSPDPSLSPAQPIPAETQSQVDTSVDRQQAPANTAPELPITPSGVVGNDVAPPAVARVQGEQIPLAMATPDPAIGQLKPDLHPDDLVKFLAGADADMRLIHSGRSGITDPQEARETMLHIIRMKLEASRRLTKNEEATEKQRSEGARGELQALSHLASLGDLKSAEELEQLARTNLESSDANVVADSRLVLIGFAMESLQNGDQTAVQEMLDTIQQIAQSEHTPDVPAMIVMGQARQVLESYGHLSEAKRVRDTIIDLFANSPNPEIAEMAAQQAGNVRFDAINDLRKQAMDGEQVALSQWTTAVATLIDESPDLQTVQYLAGCALEYESLEMNDFAAVTYQSMQTHFSDSNTATGIETQLAIDAHQARQDVIGTSFEPNLMSIDGTSVEIASYQGKVLLLPFWATSFPESLQLIPKLIEIRDRLPEKVEILGVNLDASGVQFDQFPELKELGFDNLRAESLPNQANPVATKFGLVSMPFVAILDREGKVAAINFTGRKLDETVDGLLGED